MKSGGGVLFTLREEDPLGSFGSISPGDCWEESVESQGQDQELAVESWTTVRTQRRKTVTWTVALALEMTVTCHWSHAMAQESREELQTTECGV